MTINPKDYDLDELRKMARERGSGDPRPDDGDAVGPDPDVEWDPFEEAGSGADDGFRARLYRELLPLTAASDDEKPYLSTLPETHAAEFLVFEWLEFLLLHGGFRGAQNALEYYESVEWVTEDVSDDLRDYLLGIDDQSAPDADGLDVDDHLLSMVYIAKLAAMN